MYIITRYLYIYNNLYVYIYIIIHTHTSYKPYKPLSTYSYTYASSAQLCCSGGHPESGQIRHLMMAEDMESVSRGIHEDTIIDMSKHGINFTMIMGLE